jgi:hypothetical protein
MYTLASQLVELPIMSLQLGLPIARPTSLIINPTTLEVMAMGCKPLQGNEDEGVVLLRDVRQFANDCIIIDGLDEIEQLDDIVRLRELGRHRFNPVDKLVVDESGQRLGKVEDYTINLKTFLVQKLYVHQSLMKSILFNNLVIDRTQIIDVTPKRFTVRDASTHQPLLQAKSLPHSPK